MPSGRGFSIDCSTFNVGWFFRKKRFDACNLEKTQLKRCLGLIELTALGIGATIGSGIYVVTPDSARNYGGPAMCISFVIAAIASILSGLCYAEMGARIPRAGSAYVYSYVAIGELWAFIVGWNMILEYVIGTASVARAAVTYIDVLAKGILTETFTTYLPIHVSFLGSYFDPISFGVTMIFAILLAIGVHESAILNNILVLVKVILLFYVVIAGCIYADLANWSLTLEQIQNATHTNDTRFGTGGFMPYGFGGVMTAASAAFYSFVGFDCISATGEEVANPRRDIPLSIVLSLVVCTIAYCSASIVFTLDTPYYNLSPATLIPKAPFGSLVISVGAIVCVPTTLFGGMYPLPRVIYTMAQDGLLFSFLGTVHPRFKTPFVATMLSGLLTALFASIFDVIQLVEMMSIGTLIAYSMVSASVLILRYRERFIDTTNDGSDDDNKQVEANTEQSITMSYVRALVTLGRDSKRPTLFSSTVAVILTSLTSVTALGTVTFAMVLVVYGRGHWWPAILLAIFAMASAILTFRFWFLPQNRTFPTFQTPGVPVLPILALTINFYLLVSLNYETWIRFSVWMTFGFIIYFAYGIWSSKERWAGCSSSEDEGAEFATIISSDGKDLTTTKMTGDATSSFSKTDVDDVSSKRLSDEKTPLLQADH